MVDGYDGSDYGDEGNPHGYSQESSDSLPPFTFRTIWECPGITLDEMEDNDGRVIPGWHCGYCHILGGIGGAQFFKYQNATKALSHCPTFLQSGVTLLVARAFRTFLPMFVMP
jgi:hypothetical protein